MVGLPTKQITVNTRLVVVGASDVAVSFIESLVYVSDLLLFLKAALIINEFSTRLPIFA